MRVPKDLGLFAHIRDLLSQKLRMLDKSRLLHFLPERAVFIPGLEADKGQNIIFILYF